MGNETYNDRLRKQLLNQRKTIQSKRSEIQSLEKQVAILKEAAEFYGDRKNWGAFDFVPNDGESFYGGNDGIKDIFIIQAGKKAREALKQIEEMQ